MEELKIEHPNDVGNREKFYRIYKKIIESINTLDSTGTELASDIETILSNPSLESEVVAATGVGADVSGAGAAPVTKNIVKVIGANNTKGVVLPAPSTTPIILTNAGANSLNIFAPTGCTFQFENNSTTNSGGLNYINIGYYKSIIFIKQSDTVWYATLLRDETTYNKVTSISAASTDVQYPSAKLLYNQLALKQNASTVKVYKALLNQSGTDAPVATVLENTLGGTVVWTYNAPGNYTATLASAFTENKTLLIMGNVLSQVLNADIMYSKVYWGTVNTILLETLQGEVSADNIANANDVLLNTPIIIEVYP